MSRPCPKCSCEEYTIGPGPTAGEMRGAQCIRCGARWWQPKAENERTKRACAHRNLVQKYGKGYCEMCLRSAGELPSGQTLEAQHILEHQTMSEDERLNDPGREGVWIVCTACHRLIHHVRTYHGHNDPAALGKAG